MGGVAEGDYTGGGSAYGSTTYSFNEYALDYSALVSTGVKGLAHCIATSRSIFKGTVKIYLPQITDGATVDWDTDNVTCIVAAHGSGPSYPDVPQAIVQEFAADQFNVTVLGDVARKVQIDLVGAQAIL